MNIIYGAIEGLWRRWFGGAYSIFNHNAWYYKIIESRGTQTIFNILFLWFLFYQSVDTAKNIFTILGLSSFLDKYSIWISLYNAIVFQFLFWSKGHGPIFDYGHGLDPSSETIKRYEEMWHTKWLDKMWKKFNLEKYFPKYGYTYDMVSMIIRYSYPAIFVGLTASFNMFLLGLFVATIYATCWSVYDDNCKWYNDNKNGLKSPTQLAELIAGFCVGFLISF